MKHGLEEHSYIDELKTIEKRYREIVTEIVTVQNYRIDYGCVENQSRCGRFV